VRGSEELYGSLDPDQQFIERLRLAVTSSKVGHGGDEYTFGIPLDDNAELSIHSALLDAVDATLEKGRPIPRAPYDYTAIRQWTWRSIPPSPALGSGMSVIAHSVVSNRAATEPKA
jgi:hypothetical protein